MHYNTSIYLYLILVSLDSEAHPLRLSRPPSTNQLAMKKDLSGREQGTGAREGAEAAAAVQDTAERMVRTQVDMIVLIVLSAGNDYLPALPGGRLKGNSLWEAYLLLRASKREWANGCDPCPSASQGFACRSLCSSRCAQAFWLRVSSLCMVYCAT